jgi:DNA mismatch endonuclease (patch repair protein)
MNNRQKIKRIGMGIWKGKTYEEIFGIEKAKEIKIKQSKSSIGKIKSKESRLKMSKSKKILFKKGKLSPWNKGLNKNTDKRVLRYASVLKKEYDKNPNIKCGFKKGHEYLGGGKFEIGNEYYKLRKKTLKGRKLSEEHKRKISEYRNKQVLPKKDTTIEIKIQNLLSALHLEFFTHKYISEIQHRYQCDIFLPEQIGITQKTIMECDGCFFHCCPICKKEGYPWTGKTRQKDKDRTKELIEAGYRVIRLWEHEIKTITLEELKRRIEDEHY